MKESDPDNSSPVIPTTEYGLLISALRLLGGYEENKVGQKWDKAYRRPVLRDRGGDLSKQWYVEFYYESEGKLKRKKVSKLSEQPSPNRLNNYYRRRSEMLIIRHSEPVNSEIFTSH